MRKISAALAGAFVVLSGCSSTAPAPPATSTTSPTPSASPSPTPLPTPTGTPFPDTKLPVSYPIKGKLTDGDAGAVVNELHRVSGELPVLKVDLTNDEATLTALQPDRSVISFVWRDGEISRTDSDIQYLQQATFDPSDFPISSIGRMFSIADLQGVRGQLMLQIVEYRAGQVLMTVTSRPETKTLFFRRDGTAVSMLGFTSVADLTTGIAEVVGQARQVYSVTINPTTGYAADLPGEAGVVINRTRPAAMPMYETKRSETPTLQTFDPSLIQPAGLAKAIARTQETPDQACTVAVDLSLNRSAPVAKVQCGSTTTYADLHGRDMTELVG